MQTKLSTVLAEKGGQVFSVGPNKHVLDAVSRMNEHGVGALLVLDEDRLVGILSERDVLQRVVAAQNDPGRSRVRDVMTSAPIVVRGDTTVGEAMAIVTERRIRHLPVIHDGVLAGVLSSGDLTRWIIRDQRYKIEDLISYITNEYPR